MTKHTVKTIAFLTALGIFVAVIGITLTVGVSMVTSIGLVMGYAILIGAIAL